jgi:hypothetical protein
MSVTAGTPETERSRSRWPDLVVLTALLVGTAVVMSGGFRAPGSEFDEGIAVTFPDRIVHGDVPYRDFESFYGPGNTYLTAFVFKIFGSSLGAERGIGFAVALLIVLALFLLGRRFGLVAGAGSGLIAALVVAWIVVAKAAYEAQALALFALVATAEAGRVGPRKRWLYAVGGLLGGAAMLFRLELAPAVLLSAVPLLVRGDWRGNSVRYICGFASMLLPYAAVAAIVGGGKLHRNFTDLRATGRDRRLPLPGLGSPDGRLLVVAVLATVIVLSIAVWHLRASRRIADSSLLLSGGILAALTLPVAFWRLDAGHVIAGSLVPLSFLPMATASVGWSSSWARKRQPWLVGGITALLVLLLLATHEIRGGIHRNLQLLQGKNRGHTISYGGRSFIIESARAARDLQEVVDVTGARAKPGDTLFVGPSDLRRTNQNDVFVYYLLPGLRPASFNVELDPPASEPGSSLPSELERADYLILTSRWNVWKEENGSRRYGSDAANRVVHDHFCVVDHAGTYRLLRRCR